jgi:hypothetical protein
MKKIGLLLLLAIASCSPENPTCGNLDSYGHLEYNYFVIVDGRRYYVDNYQDVLGFENGLGSFVCL